jgi:hypothetical protein
MKMDQSIHRNIIVAHHLLSKKILTHEELASSHPTLYRLLVKTPNSFYGTQGTLTSH